MDTYVTGSIIKRLREEKKMTQEELAEKIGVTGKAVSKWETGKGYPDITLLESIAGAFSISVIELLSGQEIRNINVSGNMLKSRIYVCPVCGNVIFAGGELQMSCCGISLFPEEAETMDGEHELSVSKVEDEIFVEINHPMTKEHYISFIAYITGDKINYVKLYPEGNAEARFSMRGSGYIYWYCNRHGLYRIRQKRI